MQQSSLEWQRTGDFEPISRHPMGKSGAGAFGGLVIPNTSTSKVQHSPGKTNQTFNVPPNLEYFVHSHPLGRGQVSDTEDRSAAYQLTNVRDFLVGTTDPNNERLIKVSPINRTLDVILREGPWWVPCN